jgi:hypothetical protein
VLQHGARSSGAIDSVLQSTCSGSEPFSSAVRNNRNCNATPYLQQKLQRVECFRTHSFIAAAETPGPEMLPGTAQAGRHDLLHGPSFNSNQDASLVGAAWAAPFERTVFGINALQALTLHSGLDPGGPPLTSGWHGLRAVLPI